MVNLNLVEFSRVKLSQILCELIAIKVALDNYPNRATKILSGILLFTECRSALQVIQRGSSQLKQDIISLLNRVFVAQRTCTLQWIPAHSDIFGNEHDDNLAKEARNSSEFSNSLTFTDADATARCKLTSHPVKKHSIPDLPENLTA
ncbi:RNase H domain-containing protein [Trichonephila clavipes]|nr:RNase H domain-containing protein [Trichonephila clavipes]